MSGTVQAGSRDKGASDAGEVEKGGIGAHIFEAGKTFGERCSSLFGIRIQVFCSPAERRSVFGGIGRW